MPNWSGPLWLLLWGLWVAPAAAAPAYVFADSEPQPFVMGSVTVRADRNVTAWARAYAQNDGPRPVRVQIRYKGEAYVQRVFDLAPGERRTVTLPKPSASGHVLVTAEGEPSASGWFYTEHGAEAIVVSLATELAFATAVGADPEDQQKASARTPTMRVVSMSRDQLPVELISYAGIDVVYLGNIALEDLDEAHRRVLEAYVATGGRLALGRCGPSTLSHLPLLQRIKSGPQDYGFGVVFGCDAQETELATFLNEKQPALSVARRGAIDEGSDEPPALLVEATPPVGRFFFIVLAFGLAVGPGSFFVARRLGSALLLVSIPGTALLTCAVIIGSAVLGEGLQTKTSTRGYTFLDPRRDRAITVGVGGFFSGVTPGELSVANNSAWLLQPASLSLGNGTTMERGFIPPRTYVEWGMSSLSPTRARLQVRERNGKLRVQNALGSKVLALYLRRDGKLWTARDLADGAEAAATQATGIPNLAHAWPLAGRLRERVLAPLEEGQFIAHLEGAGFLPLGTLSAQHLGSEQLVRGEVSR